MPKLKPSYLMLWSFSDTKRHTVGSSPKMVRYYYSSYRRYKNHNCDLLGKYFGPVVYMDSEKWA